MKTSHDYATLEAIAKMICSLCGSNWDAKGCKRNHWRKRAAMVMDNDIKKARNNSYVARFWNEP